MQACQQMCEVLIEAGIDHVFGIPGGGTSPLFNAIHDHRDKIRFILTRHEQAASIMADVYGRLTGKPGVVLGQGVFIGSSGVHPALQWRPAPRQSTLPENHPLAVGLMGTFGQPVAYAVCLRRRAVCNRLPPLSQHDAPRKPELIDPPGSRLFSSTSTRATPAGSFRLLSPLSRRALAARVSAWRSRRTSHRPSKKPKPPTCRR
jgi:hypothetical protein